MLVARALVQEAAALVLDEPTASLDFGNQALVLRQIRSLAKQDGLAILLTTHQPDHALLIADEATVLHQGRFIAGPAPPEEVVTAERLHEAYGVEAVVGSLISPHGPRQVCVPLLR